MFFLGITREMVRMMRMNILITGANGTVGKAVAETARAQGDTVFAWDRSIAPPDDPSAGERLIDTTRPDAILHLAIPSQGTGRPDEGRLVNIDWTRHLASCCRQRDLRFLYASTAMVFTDFAKGPFHVDAPPDATEGYGGEKRRGELAALEAYPQTIVTRLGWQIGHAPGGNNMLEFLVNKMKTDGVIGASRKWLPATSFVTDTAAALLRLARGNGSGIYQINANDRWNFLEIVLALNQRHGGTWRVEGNDDFVYDQRLIDDRTGMPPLSDSLPELLSASL